MNRLASGWKISHSFSLDLLYEQRRKPSARNKRGQGFHMILLSWGAQTRSYMPMQGNYRQDWRDSVTFSKTPHF